METQEAERRLYDAFNMGKIEKNIERKAKEQAKIQPELPPEPVDIYQRNQDRIYEVSQKSYPKGSSAIVNMAVASVIDGAGSEGLARAYKRAKGDIAALAEQGERGRAELRRQQYMQEDFLPALEVVINSDSPDALLSNEKALSDLDQYVLLPSKASGKAYTASYVRQAYGNQLGQVNGRSNGSVRSGVRRMNALLNDGSVRSAVGIANNLKKKIDEGSAEADSSDYELISRIVAYYS